MTKSIRGPGLWALVVLSLAPLQACTDLTETPSSAITPENFYRNEAEVLGGLAAVYSDLTSQQLLWNYYNVSEISSDEMIVPTRGQDWYDNGRWLEIHRQEWSATSGSGLDDIAGIWTISFRGVARANVVLDALSRVDITNEAVITAELRGLRAFYYYLLMDVFGGAPIVTDIEVKARARNTRAEVFQFIESELLAISADLPATRPAGENGRLTRGAADAILANMYLNAGVFTKDVGVSATAYNSCSGVQVTGGADACQAAIDAADRILNSGVYQLADSFVKNFRHNNELSPENIFVAKHLNQPGLGLTFVQRALHYNQFSPSPWNGFSALAQTYNAFDANDQRRQIFLVGPQVNVETGQPATDRNNQPLVFTPTIIDATSATEGEGARIYKWPADPAHVAQENGNDFAYFRLGEMYLIKAEALNEQTPGSPAALLLVNTLRARAFNPPQPIAAVDRAALLQERLFELTAEGKRRQDLVRHGRYTEAWEFKTAGAPHLILMPIPQPQLDANPLLVQNPGY